MEHPEVSGERGPEEQALSSVPPSEESQIVALAALPISSEALRQLIRTPALCQVLSWVPAVLGQRKPSRTLAAHVYHLGEIACGQLPELLSPTGSRDCLCPAGRTGSVGPEGMFWEAVSSVMA